MENHADRSAGLAQLARGNRGEIEPADADDALRRPLQGRQAANERRLSGSGFADDAVDVSLGDLKVDVVQGDDRLLPAPRIDFGHTAQRYHDSSIDRGGSTRPPGLLQRRRATSLDCSR